MSSYVALQQPRSRERFTAIRTFASLTVGTNVHRESRNRHVNFVAMRATSRLKKSQISLAISVQFQIIFLKIYLLISWRSMSLPVSG